MSLTLCGIVYTFARICSNVTRITHAGGNDACVSRVCVSRVCVSCVCVSRVCFCMCLSVSLCVLLLVGSDGANGGVPVSSVYNKQPRDHRSAVVPCACTHNTQHTHKYTELWTVSRTRILHYMSIRAHTHTQKTSTHPEHTHPEHTHTHTHTRA